MTGERHIYYRYVCLTYRPATFRGVRLPVPYDMVPMPTCFMSKLDSISDKRIPQLLAKEGLAVVLLSSPWDGNGVIMRTIVEGVAEQFQQVSFYQADYESSPRLARLFNLLSPPGLLFIRDGELVSRVTKPMSAGGVRDLIQSIA